MLRSGTCEQTQENTRKKPLLGATVPDFAPKDADPSSDWLHDRERGLCVATAQFFPAAAIRRAQACHRKILAVLASLAGPLRVASVYEKSSVRSAAWQEGSLT